MDMLVSVFAEFQDVSCNNSMLMPREVSDECPQSWEQVNSQLQSVHMQFSYF